jgi:N-methylhydantoinase B/oxoprolinase/acetone carboxylase alpha subunit
MTAAAAVDPITLTVIWNSLISIADELGITLRHTAFSEGVREGDDFSTALFDRNAVLIAQGNFSPGHLGSMPAMAKHVLRYFPVETLKLGDSILVNDSFIGAGHFPDTYQIMPVFLADRLIGFVACSAHQVDMGGAAPGSQKVHGVTEAFQEGLRILPVRLVREGKIDDDIMRIVLGNVRMPDKVRGDLLAQHTANLTAAERLAKMFRSYGSDTVERTYAAILDRSEQKMRAALAQVPAGTYSFEDHMDDYGPGTEPIRMAVDITFDGKGEVEFDFSRSSTRCRRRSIPTSTTRAPMRCSPSNRSAAQSSRRPKAACGRSSSRFAKVRSSIRNSQRHRAAGRPCRSAFTIRSTAHWRRRCHVGRWARSRTGPIQTSAASTTEQESRSSCTTYRLPAMAAASATTGWKA